MNFQLNCGLTNVFKAALLAGQHFDQSSSQIVTEREREWTRERETGEREILYLKWIGSSKGSQLIKKPWCVIERIVLLTEASFKRTLKPTSSNEQHMYGSENEWTLQLKKKLELVRLSEQVQSRSQNIGTVKCKKLRSYIYFKVTSIFVTTSLGQRITICVYK